MNPSTRISSKVIDAQTAFIERRFQRGYIDPATGECLSNSTNMDGANDIPAVTQVDFVNKKVIDAIIDTASATSDDLPPIS